MANVTMDPVWGLCPPPFFQESMFEGSKGYIDGRLCAPMGPVSCCLPCPLTEWAYSDFPKMELAAEWINVASLICCVFLMLSWIFLPVEKTHRHYLSISLTCAVILLSLGFIVPLAAKPDQCSDAITPHGMDTSPVCAVSGAFLLFGGWGGVMWVFLRALSLHLQIVWTMVPGRHYLWFSQIIGWGIPIIGLIVLMVFSGVSFRFGDTCHINHVNSLADFWIPLLCFAGLTVIIQFSTFAYCIKVYIASLADNSTTTEGSGLPSYAASIQTMTPRQAYRRARRVMELQWRGIVIVLIILCDVILFAVVFVFQDNTVVAAKENSQLAMPWVKCLMATGGDKNSCLEQANGLVVSLPSVTATFMLLAMNGLWLILLFGRWSMVTGWVELFKEPSSNKDRRDVVRMETRPEYAHDGRPYEMLSHDTGKAEVMLTPVSPIKAPEESLQDGRRTPDYFGQSPESFGPAARYHPHQRSFSSPRPPRVAAWEEGKAAARSPPMGPAWEEGPSPARSPPRVWNEGREPPARSPPRAAAWEEGRFPARSPPRSPPRGVDHMNPLGMNRF